MTKNERGIFSPFVYFFKEVSNMYYSGSLQDIILKNTAIIGVRESGKTTILKKLIELCSREKYIILVFDSATDHKNKSILIDTLSKYNNCNLISSPEKELILFNNIAPTSFPYNNIKDSNNEIYLFDVSKYLEEGYETDDLKKRTITRGFYKQLVIQILTVFLPMLKNKKCIVIMDEIEFTTKVKDIILQYNSFDINFVCSLHEHTSLSTSDKLFKKIFL